MEFLTPEIFDLLVIVTIILGLALAGVRLYDDLTRPLSDERSHSLDEDTRPHPAIRQQPEDTAAD